MKRGSNVVPASQRAPTARGQESPPRPDAHPRAEQTDRQGPGLGDWDGPIYGELGVLATDEERAQCHICGHWYIFLGRHVVFAHRISCDDYRTIFGLRKAHGLVGPGMREVCRQQAQRNLNGHWKRAGEIIQALPPEQRPAEGRKWPLEALIDPKNQAAQHEAARRGGQKTHERFVAGEWVPPTRDKARAALVKGRARLHELLRDPEWKETWRQSVSEGRPKQPPVRVSCVICGTAFDVPAWCKRRC